MGVCRETREPPNGPEQDEGRWCWGRRGTAAGTVRPRRIGSPAQVAGPGSPKVGGAPRRPSP